ncbi:MAG: Protein of unknown function (DUF4231) [Candidatus Electronema aureum]|uniref:SMODS and SLOG-associating 2TM effector domain-containing protein n=1 Tax=Candidatus Electronema aureum TaxID=2005002 RepID=A0A521FYU4_9BACT|nr:MAG: Protein of unknown function (DUF4231) [Candidatus Electronema aureum]
MQKHIEDKISFLKQEVDLKIKSFEEKRTFNRKMSSYLNMTLIIISALITIFLGIEQDTYKIFFKNLALVLSASLTVLSTLDSFFNYKKLWVKYTDTTNDLKALKTDILYSCIKSDENISEQVIDKFYDRYISILKDTNQHWIQSRLKPEQK